jgi:thermitase
VKKLLTGLVVLGMMAGCAAPPTPPPQATFALDSLDEGGTWRLMAASGDEAVGMIVHSAGSVPTLDGEVSRKDLPVKGFKVVKLRASKVKAALARLARTPGISSAEFDAPTEGAMVPTDSDFPKQVGMTKVGMPTAWDITRGAGAPLVAVIDTGVNYNHPDLAGRVVKGYDFVNSDADPMDDHSHGTHCAGTIGAAMNNGGVVGVAPEVRILAVKVLNGSNSGTISGLIGGIDFAVKNGAKVLSISICTTSNSTALRTAVNNALAAGVAVVAAAGNNGNSTPLYPAAISGVISVGAVDNADVKASFSNFGTWVSIAAPGVSVYNTVLSGYGNKSGTSMATPHVAGAAALVLATTPGLTPAQVKQRLETTGDPCTGFEANPAVRRLNVAKALAVAVPTPAPTATPTPAPASNLMYSGVYAREVTAATARVTWNTNLPADSRVEWSLSPTTGYAVKGSDPALVTAHSVPCSGLTPGRYNYFRIRTRDASGTEKISAYQYVLTPAQ